MGLVWLREKGHRAECQNRLRLGGVGLDHYHQAKGHFPAGTVPNAGLEPERRLSWIYSILPYMGQETPNRANVGNESQTQALFGKINPTLAWDDPANLPATQTPLPVTRCPSYPQSHGALYWTTYIGIAGLGEDAPRLPAKAANCGVFGYDRTTSYEDVAAGISETMMVAETEQKLGPWAQGGPATVRGIDPSLEHPVGPGKPFGGLHPGGVNVLFVDQSVRFLPNNIEPDIWIRQALIVQPDSP
jgi:prepilin-type processing-associated H-X9-DG protein